MNKNDLSWFWVSQRMQLITYDDPIYSVFPVQIHTTISKEAGLIFVHLCFGFQKQFRNLG